MKISIERASLLKAMNRAQGVVERRTTIPILSNVLLEAGGDSLTIRATDLDIEVMERAPVMVEQAGSVTVAAHTLHEIVRKLPDGSTVSLSYNIESGRIDVAAGRSKFSLPTLPKDDFPVMASSEYECEFQAPAATLRRLFDKAKFAMSTEETRYYLNGVYMHVADGNGGRKLRCVATDGHRLARIDAELPAGAETAPGVIVPRKTVLELKKLLEDDEAMVSVSVSETKIRFGTAELQLTSKVIDGSFPDYTRVIPVGNNKKMELDANDFAHSVDRVSTVASDQTKAVKLSLDEDRLVLSVNTPDSGAAVDELAVAYGDEPLDIGFNAKYLLEIAGQIDRENAVFMFNSPADPTLVREGDDESAVYVVMPMRV